MAIVIKKMTILWDVVFLSASRSELLKTGFESEIEARAWIARHKKGILSISDDLSRLLLRKSKHEV